jgi:hypothetical protein
MNHAHDSICAVAVVAAPSTVAASEATPLAARRPTLSECVLAACDRDPDAAEVVATRLRPRLLAQIERTLEEHAQDAEDVLDALFLEMLDGGITIAAAGSPIDQLMTVARNRARERRLELRKDSEEGREQGDDAEED